MQPLVEQRQKRRVHHGACRSHHREPARAEDAVRRALVEPADPQLGPWPQRLASILATESSSNWSLAGSPIQHQLGKSTTTHPFRRWATTSPSVLEQRRMPVSETRVPIPTSGGSSWLMASSTQ